VSTSTAGQDFGAHAAALFVKPSNNQEDEDCVSNHGSGILDLDGVDPGSEALSQDWNLELLERSFTAVQDGGDGGGSQRMVVRIAVGKLKVHLYFILANQGHNCTTGTGTICRSIAPTHASGYDVSTSYHCHTT